MGDTRSWRVLRLILVSRQRLGFEPKTPQHEKGPSAKMFHDQHWKLDIHYVMTVKTKMTHLRFRLYLFDVPISHT